MRLIAKILALTSLLLLTLPSVFYLAGKMSLETVKWIMILATIVWFVSASFWMWPRAENSAG
jgi:hypothetical protein